MTELEHIATKLGWQKAMPTDLETTQQHYIVTTALLRFKDDIVITIHPADNNQITMHMVAKSRIGRADFGTNLSHITRLIDELDKQLK